MSNAGILFTSTKTLQPAQNQPSFFGQPANPIATTAAPVQPSLFGRPVTTLGTAPTQLQSSIFGPPSTTANNPTQLDVTGATQRNAQRTLPMEQEVPAALVQLLEGCKNKMKENSEALAKLNMNKPSGAQKQTEALGNACVLLNRAKFDQTTAMADAKKFMVKVRSDAHDAKILAKIPGDAKLRPGQANDALSDLLAKTGNELQMNIEKLKEKIATLEAPLREYLEAKDGAKAMKNISKQELFDHIQRTVGICDYLFMNVTGLHDQVETVLCVDTDGWKKDRKGF
ncbi:hypothetical protein M3Y95_00946400 [Aphelenchoides besseyi]|nr:hypothetical protein M3Y95_00946400 [Aphelenchoides besseyi]